MTALARRDILQAIAALGLGAALIPVAGQAATATPLDGLDPAGAGRIGQAWLARNPGVDAAGLTRRLFPNGQSTAALEALRLRAATDFRQRRVFRHRGWRLSDTEGALFGLAALTTR